MTFAMKTCKCGRTLPPKKPGRGRGPAYCNQPECPFFSPKKRPVVKFCDGCGADGRTVHLKPEKVPGADMHVFWCRACRKLEAEERAA